MKKLSRSPSEDQRGSSSSIYPELWLPSALGESWESAISPTTSPDFHEEGALEEATSWSGQALAGHSGHHRSLQCTAATSAPSPCSHSFRVTERQRGREEDYNPLVSTEKSCADRSSLCKMPKENFIFIFHVWNESRLFPRNFKNCQVDLLLSKLPPLLKRNQLLSVWVPLAVKMQMKVFLLYHWSAVPKLVLAYHWFHRAVCTYWHLSSCFALTGASVLGDLLTLLLVSWSIPVQHVAIVFREMKIPESPTVGNRIK